MPTVVSDMYSKSNSTFGESYISRLQQTSTDSSKHMSIDKALQFSHLKWARGAFKQFMRGIMISIHNCWWTNTEKV